ncbi:MAG: carboxymuconolactone decarboxylase family protein [Hyphomonadaceae bacterium]|nr:carboxymuconolactone decarboxylase family protein [Hyphomonadaceae bacterium]
MSIDALLEHTVGYAADQKRNLAALIAAPGLTEQQKWGCLLACAYATQSQPLIKAMEMETTIRLAPVARLAAKSAATVMAMNTVYYTAINLLSNHDYRRQPAGLDMTALGQSDVDKIDFELWAFAVSAIYQCGPCLNAHEAELHKRNVPIDHIQTALRIAALVNALAQILSIEEALA